ncbi:hypothetical protein ASPWEDRAFT_45561 [Aspergillus wentii DTO 134E9]|uniref:Uncharacterized protein n=1 Tax=Aspergillus wentii DTO 134E9 TaxID=1073089 RepID=A0A1L9R9P9_ASPWE|nr:uncharacterized protein ASPWEDRAFT_45561 [Aspergillus wentii DTO 134E9]OJJ31603.1 hypothetical protein ASPWEDRAFT_45561 [Aspergillus wentii DTO 134E9]
MIRLLCSLDDLLTAYNSQTWLGCLRGVYLARTYDTHGSGKEDGRKKRRKQATNRRNAKKSTQ